jgi:hypothetical protein
MWAYALLTVLRVAHLPAAPPLKTIVQGSWRSSLTACKASRGLGGRCACARDGISSGVLCWRRSRASNGFWLGPPGAAGLKGSPSIGTIHVALLHKYNCSTSLDSHVREKT